MPTASGRSVHRRRWSRPAGRRRLPILTLLSGPAGGAIAALAGQAGSAADLLDARHGRHQLRRHRRGRRRARTRRLGRRRPHHRLPDERHPDDRRGRRQHRLGRRLRLAEGRPAVGRRHPGPACYGRGGTEPRSPTRTSCSAGTTRGAPRRRGRARSRAGRERRSRPSPSPSGWSSSRLPPGSSASSHAHRHAVRAVSVERGRDLRDFALVAYGGAGPAHAGRGRPRSGDHARPRPADSRLRLGVRHPQHRRPPRYGRGVRRPTDDVEPTAVGRSSASSPPRPPASRRDGAPRPARSLHRGWTCATGARRTN